MAALIYGFGIFSSVKGWPGMAFIRKNVIVIIIKIVIRDDTILLRKYLIIVPPS